MIKLANKKFGVASPDFETKVMNCSEIEKLDNIIDNIFDLDSYEKIAEILN